MPIPKYHTFFVICLSIGGAIGPQAWGQKAGGIQEETIELPKHEEIKPQNLALPSATSGAIIEENIPLSSEQPLNPSIHEADIQAPENPERQLAEQQAETQGQTGMEYLGRSASKFGGGVLDIATSWLEIPKTIAKVTREEGVASGLTIGVAKGIANTAEQAVSGAVNVATFPVPQNLEIDMVENADGEFSMEDSFGAAFKGDEAVEE